MVSEMAEVAWFYPTTIGIWWSSSLKDMGAPLNKGLEKGV